MMMAFDVVYRWLQCAGYRVSYVRNITDIDDKIIRRAVERNLPISTLTDEMIAAMHEDTKCLGIQAPTLEPRATQYVPQMLNLIAKLEKKGLAYKAASGDVNFSVRQFAGYGKLSGKSPDELRSGERVAVTQDKQDPLDFVVWKAAKPTEPPDAQWDCAILGHDYVKGRPGWHIECSAMSCHTLGESFDIHGGGSDLQFPHHENEIAQSEGASGKPLARFWMHNGFVRVDGEKMSKSLGNFFTIRDVLSKYDAQTVRFFLLRTHYRTALNYSDASLDDARAGLRRLYTALTLVPAETLPVIDWSAPFARRFKAAMDEDFGTPEAIAVLFDLASEVNKKKSVELASLLKTLGGCLGLLQGSAQEFLQSRVTLDTAAIQIRIAQRSAAKAARDFVLADSIRDELLAQGVALQDSPTGTTWESV